MRFSNFPDYLSYEDFRIFVRMNQHSECTVTMTIAPEKESAFLSLARQRVRTEITADSGNFIMSGMVTSVTVRADKQTVTKAEITVISESLLLQEKGENRIYQNPEKTFADILKHYPEVKTGKCEHLHDKLPEVIYQYDMDDFTFLCFLAQKCQTSLWITDDGKVSFGQINYEKTFSGSETAYQKSILERSVRADNQQEEITILTLEQIPSGAVLNVQGTDYVIYETEIYEEYEETCFRYTAGTKPSCRAEQTVLKNWTVPAEVTDNQDKENLGRIQVRITDWEDKDSERVWIPYLTTYIGKNQGGVVMLPDTGDTVILHMADGFLYADGSLRKEALPEHCRNIEQKFFSMKNTLITLEENQITASEGEKTKLTLTEEKITAEEDTTHLTLNQDSGILETKQAECRINDDSISAKAGNSSLTLEQSVLSAKNGSSSLMLEQSALSAKNSSSSLKLESGSLTAQNNSGKLLLSGQKASLSGAGAQASLDSTTAELSGMNINLKTQAFST